MRIKPTTINSLVMKFPAKPGVSGNWSGMSGQRRPEFPDIYPESPGNCSPSVKFSETGVSGPQCSEYLDIYSEYPSTL
jgi:hypothetical protein